MADMSLRRPVVLGRVHGLFGVRGWIKVYSYTRPLDAILDYPTWWVGTDNTLRCFHVIEARAQGKTLVAHLADSSDTPLPDRNAAAELVDLDIAVDRSDLPDLESGRYYWVDLIGLTVVNMDGVNFGHIAAMMETGANDVMVVRGDRERLIPMVMDEFVKSVNIESKHMTVDWDPDF